MSEDNSYPTRRTVLKATGASSLFVGGAVVGSGLTAADHQGDSCTPEPGLQGQVPLENQVPGRTEPYCRNMRRVGQNTIEDRGANFTLNWHKDHAYVGQAHLGALAGNENRNDPVTDDPLWGTAVIDASDPENPEMTTVVQTPAHFNTWEALSISDRRELMVCSGNTEYMDVHDLSDPADPRHLSSIDLPRHSHGLVLSPDGNTAYISLEATNTEGDPGLLAYDISDPSHPELITTYTGNRNLAHDLNISLNGMRLYLALRGTNGSGGGVLVLDTSEIERREFGASFRRMGAYRHSDHEHAGVVFRKNGREYFITQSEADGDGGKLGGCPWGYARIHDVTDGWAPQLVSEFRLEVNKYVNCHLTQKDTGPNPGLLSGISFYSAHYGGVGQVRDTNAAFFSWYGAGLRVADIRDIENPTEIAYYNPPPNPNTKFQQYSIWSQNTLFADGTPSYVRYRPETGHIWVVSVQNGFQILELTGGAKDIPR